MTVSGNYFGLTQTVRSDNTRSREQARRPLRAETVAELKEFLKNKMPDTKAFGGTYKALTDKTAKTLRADLAEAGIDYQDETGRLRGIHFLTHTIASWLACV